MWETLDRIDSPEDFIYDPYLALCLPLYMLDGASFMSRDAYGHLCTVTGALWRPNGRYFDGVDDLISIPSHASLDTLATPAYIVWLKGTLNPTGYSMAWSKETAPNVGSYASFYYKRLEICMRGETYAVSSTGPAVVYNDNQWYCLAWQIDWNGDRKIYIWMDGQPVTLTRQDAGSARLADTITRLGVYPDLALGFWNGVIRGFRVFQQNLPPAQFQNIYQQERHLYGV